MYYLGVNSCMVIMQLVFGLILLYIKSWLFSCCRYMLYVYAHNQGADSCSIAAYANLTVCGRARPFYLVLSVNDMFYVLMRPVSAEKGFELDQQRIKLIIVINQKSFNEFIYCSFVICTLSNLNYFPLRFLSLFIKISF